MSLSEIIEAVGALTEEELSTWVIDYQYQGIDITAILKKILNAVNGKKGGSQDAFISWSYQT